MDAIIYDGGWRRGDACPRHDMISKAPAEITALTARAPSRPTEDVKSAAAPPVLVIGQFQPGNPPSLGSVKRFSIAPVAGSPEKYSC
jgi:hypothetical protein